MPRANHDFCYCSECKGSRHLSVRTIGRHFLRDRNDEPEHPSSIRATMTAAKSADRGNDDDSSHPSGSDDDRSCNLSEPSEEGSASDADDEKKQVLLPLHKAQREKCAAMFIHGNEDGELNDVLAAPAPKRRRTHRHARVQGVTNHLKSLHKSKSDAMVSRDTTTRLLKSFKTNIEPLLNATRGEDEKIDVPESAKGPSTWFAQTQEDNDLNEFEAIDVCEAECILFRGEHSQLTACPMCHEHRCEETTGSPKRRMHFRSILAHLKELLEDERFHSLLHIVDECVEGVYKDVSDGSLYQAFRARNADNPLTQVQHVVCV